MSRFLNDTAAHSSWFPVTLYNFKLPSKHVRGVLDKEDEFEALKELYCKLYPLCSAVTVNTPLWCYVRGSSCGSLNGSVG